MQLETETWIWNLKLRLEIEAWITNLKLKNEIETSNWNLKLKLEFFGPMGLFLRSRSGSKTFLEPTIIDYKFLFWKYNPIFLFLMRPNFGPFCTLGAFGAIFGVEVRFKSFLGPIYIDQQLLFWLNIAILMKTKLSAFDFDCRLWVCQHPRASSDKKMINEERICQK